MNIFFLRKKNYIKNAQGIPRFEYAAYIIVFFYYFIIILYNIILIILLL